MEKSTNEFTGPNLWITQHSGPSFTKTNKKGVKCNHHRLLNLWITGIRISTGRGKGEEGEENIFFVVKWACVSARAHVYLYAYVLSTCIHISKNNVSNSSNLWETLIFICTSKINLIHQLSLEIFQFKESCNLIGQEHFVPKFKEFSFCVVFRKSND